MAELFNDESGSLFVCGDDICDVVTIQPGQAIRIPKSRTYRKADHNESSDLLIVGAPEETPNV